MGTLALQAQQISKKKDSIYEALVHFDSALEDDSDLKAKLAAAAEFAFTDDLLSEKFNHWLEDRDDEVLLFHVNKFFEKRHLRQIPESERDLTKDRASIEKSIKMKVREKQKRIFAERFLILSVERGLTTNEELGKFLEIGEEQARRLKAGDQKPQVATLINIAKKFNVRFEYLIGLDDRRV